MKTITASEARKKISHILDAVVHKNEVVGIARHNRIDALVIKFPTTYDPLLDDTTNLNAAGGSFDFLANEPDLYTLDDAKEVYV